MDRHKDGKGEHLPKLDILAAEHHLKISFRYKIRQDRLYLFHLGGIHMLQQQQLYVVHIGYVQGKYKKVPLH